MYREQFGLKEKPFSLIPDPEYLFFSPKHRTAFTMLEYGLLEQNGITVITGEVGSGKTTLIRLLLKRIDYDEYTVGMVNSISSSHEDMLQWVGTAFDIPCEDLSHVALYRKLQDFFIDEFAKGKRIVLIVDEAQNIEEQALEELRLLSNINADKDQLVQIVLVGQPELLETLRQPSLRQLAQRVSSEFHLRPLDHTETENYIRHRLQVAGSQKALFTEPAMLAIYYFSGGVPRLINTLCDQALVLAYGEDKLRVDLDVALETIKGKRIGGVDYYQKKSSPALAKARALLQKEWDIDVAKVIDID